MEYRELAITAHTVNVEEACPRGSKMSHVTKVCSLFYKHNPLILKKTQALA